MLAEFRCIGFYPNIFMSTTLSEAETTSKKAVPWFAAPPVHDIALELPTWYTEHQSKSWERFLELPDPVRKDENWRFADLRKVRFSELVSARPVDNVETLVQRAKKERVDHFSAHYVFANNRLVYSEVADLPEGAVCLPINEALAQHGDLVKEHFMKEEETLGGEKFSSLHGALEYLETTGGRPPHAVT